MGQDPTKQEPWLDKEGNCPGLSFKWIPWADGQGVVGITGRAGQAHQCPQDPGSVSAACGACFSMQVVDLE